MRTRKSGFLILLLVPGCYLQRWRRSLPARRGILEKRGNGFPARTGCSSRRLFQKTQLGLVLPGFIEISLGNGRIVSLPA